MTKKTKTIHGVVARAIGITGGLFTLAPGVAILLVVGSVSGSSLFPPSIERVIESTLPVVGAIPDGTLPLIPVAVLVLVGGFFTLGGMMIIANALLKPDYSVDVGNTGPSGGFGGG